jgi:hypothetical protein
MDDTLKGALAEYFGHQKRFDVADIFRFYSSRDAHISLSAVRWRIHALVQGGVIQRVGRGIYRLGKSNPFQPDLSPAIKKTARRIKKAFPYANFCVWELATANHFGHHLINFNILFVDVERDATEAVYCKLKEKNRHVTNIRKARDDISELAGTVCVRPLVSQAPAQEWEHIPVASLEKILVDVATDKEFFPFQGNEIFAIYGSAFEQYTINENRMLRYAARKEKKVRIQELIDAIKRQ